MQVSMAYFGCLVFCWLHDLQAYKLLSLAHELNANAGVVGQPFDVGPRSQKWVVEHLCQCKDRCCCAPWHLEIRESRKNTMSGQYARAHRGGVSGEFDYRNDTPNILANPVVSCWFFTRSFFCLALQTLRCALHAGWPQDPPHPSTSPRRIREEAFE